MGIEELEAEIKKLPLKERGALVQRIIESLDDLSAAEIEALWAEEAEYRLEEMVEGRAGEIPAEEALRRARAAIA